MFLMFPSERPPRTFCPVCSPVSSLFFVGRYFFVCVLLFIPTGTPPSRGKLHATAAGFFSLGGILGSPLLFVNNFLFIVILASTMSR